MKTFLAATVASLVLALTASADWVIESQIENPQMNTKTITKIKGDKVRTDIASGPMGAMSSIMDAATGESTQLMHAQKMAMKTSAEQMKAAMEMAKKMSGVQGDLSAIKPQATGEKEKVGGYDCEVWTWTAGQTATKFWVTKDHPQAAVLKDMEKKMKGGALGGLQSGPDTAALPGVPIKTETTAMGMKTTMTILAVKEEAVDAKEFEVPAGYNAMAMPALPAAK